MLMAEPQGLSPWIRTKVQSDDVKVHIVFIYALYICLKINESVRDHLWLNKVHRRGQECGCELAHIFLILNCDVM